MKDIDVTALGELLVDMAPGELTPKGNYTFEACPGGAPCNVLAVLSKKNLKTSFIGKVGDDFLGKSLATRLESNGINTEGLVLDSQVKTTLAFVHKKEDGDRDFSFYRKPGADIMLSCDEVKMDLIERSKIFHFGTLSLTDNPVKDATIAAVKTAKKSNTLISFDPNLREPLWDSMDNAKEQIIWGLEHCDILKISDNEVTFITGETDMRIGFEKIHELSSAKIIFVTLGKDGSMGWCGDELVFVPGEKVECVVDTTGAGDTFMGCALDYIINSNLSITSNDLEPLLKRANHEAAQITKVKGTLL